MTALPSDQETLGRRRSRLLGMLISFAVTLVAFAIAWAEDPYGDEAWWWVALVLVGAFVIGGMALATGKKTRGLRAGLAIGALAALGVVYLLGFCLVMQIGS